MPRLEEIRKAVLAFVAVAVGYGAIALDVFQESDLSTTNGIIAAVFALLTGFGVYSIPNKQ